MQASSYLHILFSVVPCQGSNLAECLSGCPLFTLLIQVKELIMSVKGDENGISLDQFRDMLMVSDDRADLASLSSHISFPAAVA